MTAPRQSLLNPSKTSVFLVCITRRSKLREMAVESAIRSFEGQDYPGTLRLLLVGDKSLPAFSRRKKSQKLHFLHIPENRFGLGELRNAAKTYVANLCSREKRTHYLMHWDDDDFCHPDRVYTQISGMRVGAISTLWSVIRHSRKTGFTQISNDGPHGELSTLCYPAQISAAFPRDGRHLNASFLQAASRTKILFDTLMRDPALCVRTHHGENVTSYTDFVRKQTVNRPLQFSETLQLNHAMHQQYPQPT